MNELTIRLENDSPTPLYEQIYEYIKEDIQNGGLPCNERLPSTRKLSQFLEVSRSTVTLAYEQLLSEGYIENRPCSGYFVKDLEGLYRLPKGALLQETKKPQKEAEFAYDFSPSGVDLSSFPHSAWRKISKSFLMEENQDFFRLGPPEGEWELRETIAAYVHQARGVNCSAKQIILGAGTDYLLMLLEILLGENAVYAFENVTYKKAHDILKTLGREVCAVPSDASGMKVSSLEKSAANAAYVMPSHQYPLGIVMPAGRRVELLKWAAAKKERFIIEDDYDSEFRYHGKPIPALQGFDSAGKVIYIGTFSKSIAPAIRMSFLILPPALLERYQEVGRRFSSTVSRMDQKILAEFLRGGYYERHLNRMRAVYKGRHDALVESLREFKDQAMISGDHAGTHLLLTLSKDLAMTEEQAIALAAKEGVRVYGLSSSCIGKLPKETTLILGYANLSEEKIREGAKKLGKILCKS